MSSFAKRQLEKMGWKEGQGLGKDGSGISTYVKVQRRDPTLQSGLGHEAGKGGADNSDMGLDALLGSLAKKGPSKRQRSRSVSSDSSEGAQDVPPPTSADAAAAPSAKTKGKTERRARSPSSSDSSSSDDENTDGGSNILNWSDTELLQKCGGVRLGRAGRHRFFNGKLARIDASHAVNAEGSEDAVEQKPRKKQ